MCARCLIKFIYYLLSLYLSVLYIIKWQGGFPPLEPAHALHVYNLAHFFDNGWILIIYFYFAKFCYSFACAFPVFFLCLYFSRKAALVAFVLFLGSPGRVRVKIDSRPFWRKRTASDEFFTILIFWMNYLCICETYLITKKASNYASLWKVQLRIKLHNLKSDNTT